MLTLSNILPNFYSIIIIMSYYQYNQIKNDFEQELQDVIDDVLGDESYQVQKEQLTNSLLDIFSRCSERHMNQMEPQYYPNNLPVLPNEFTNSNNCFSNLPINLYVLVDPQNSFPTQPLYYPQPTINPPMQQNPLQMTMIQQPPILPPPNLLYFPQLPFLDPIMPKKSEKSKKKHKKEKKRSHKSKDISDKKKKKESKEEEKEEKKEKKEIVDIKTFILQPGNEFKGIFQYLSTTKSGNIHDNGIINVTSNNLRNAGNSRYHPKNVVDSNINKEYMASGGNQAFICFDFKDKKVEITDYAVRNSNSGGKIRNWVFEISDDMKTWTEIDKRTEYLFTGNQGIFKVRPNRFARYCRLRHDGQFTEMVFNLIINTIELFGKLQIPKKSEF